MKELVRIEGLWVEYGSITVLEDINLVVEECDFLGIIGPNGGGKTTLLKAVLNLIRPSKGRVWIGGLPPEKARDLVG
jgi:zinc transport system ATP-binding protein